MVQFRSDSPHPLTCELPSRYHGLRFERRESNGLVCTATDRLTQKAVAVKQLVEPFRTPERALRTFQELKLARCLRHENVSEMCGVFVSPEDDVYLITESHGVPLQQALLSWRLEGSATKMIFYQILRGLKYLHSANVVHCNLTPSSILIDHNYDVRIADLGQSQLQGTKITSYAATRYSSAPEILLQQRVYDTSVDMWSAGCVLAEMLDGHILFAAKGTDLDRLCAITKLLGKADGLAHVRKPEFRYAINYLPDDQQQLLCNKLDCVDPAAINLLEHLITFNPRERYDAIEALAHDYLAICHEPSDEPTSSTSWQEPDFDCRELSAKVWRNLVLSEIHNYHERISLTPERNATTL